MVIARLIVPLWRQALQCGTAKRSARANTIVHRQPLVVIPWAMAARLCLQDDRGITTVVTVSPVDALLLQRIGTPDGLVGTRNGTLLPRW